MNYQETLILKGKKGNWKYEFIIGKLGIDECFACSRKTRRKGGASEPKPIFIRYAHTSRADGEANGYCFTHSEWNIEDWTKKMVDEDQKESKREELLNKLWEFKED